MNERIKQLAKQAKKSATKNGAYNLAFVMPEFQQKFAELIVLECMKVAKPNYMSTPEDSVYYVEQAINRIAEHFGVEE